MFLPTSHSDASELSDTRASRSHDMGTRPVALDDFQAAVWVQAYDAAWLGKNWDALEHLVTPDVTFVSTDFVHAIAGRRAVLNHLRSTMARTHVHEYNATDLKGYTSGPFGVITYRWQLDWTVDRERRSGTGCDVLALHPNALGRWQLAWRVQMIRQRPGMDLARGWPSDWQ
jgi:hypothetical protein